MPEATERLHETRPEPRMQILKAAGEVFFREGFSRSSVDSIAATAHMSKQSIYEFFPNKMALFEAAVRDTLEAADRKLAKIEQTDDLTETLVGYGQRLFDAMVDPAAFGLFRANIVAAKQFSDLADMLHTHRLARAQTLADYLTSLIAEHRLAPMDTLATSTRFGGMAVEGSRYFLGAPMPDPPAQEALARAAANLFLHGYRKHTQEVPAAATALLDALTPPELEGTAALRLSLDKLDRLLDAALQEFLEHGYIGANIQRIASSVQSSKATIYRQFGNKERLVRFLLEREIFRSGRAVFGTVATGDAERDLARLAREALDWHLVPSTIRLHWLLIEECDLLPDLAQRFFDVRVAAMARALEDVLTANGMPLPNEFAARAFYALATYSVRFLTLRSVPDAPQRDSYSRECAALFLRGLSPA